MESCLKTEFQLYFGQTNSEYIDEQQLACLRESITVP